MKYLFLLPLILLLACGKNSEKATAVAEPSQFIGAWETTLTLDGKDYTGLAIVAPNYLTSTVYDVDRQEFVRTLVAKWSIDTLGRFVEHIDFHSGDSNEAGKTYIMDFEITEDGAGLMFEGKEQTWARIDDGSPGALNGAWLITGRMRDGEVSRSTPGARKTMKILSGTKFQWVAYNDETNRFSGTGGGSYTTVDSKYTENIEFFSRDSSRVGASLEFTYKLDSGEWHHSGLSSRGDTIYEIWTPREWLEE